MPNEQNNNVAYIESHQYINRSIKDLNKNMIVAVGTKVNNAKELTWNLGIVAALAVRTYHIRDPNAEQYDGMLAIHLWSGDCITLDDGSSFPALFLEDTWDKAKKHLTLERIKFDKRSCLKVIALNQFNGILPCGKDGYAVGIINEVDGCLQCSYGGPDSYGIAVPHPRLPKSLSTKYNPVPDSIPINYKRNTNTVQRKRSVKVAEDNGESEIAFINRAQNFIPKQKEVTAVIVTDGQNNPLSLKDISYIKEEWKDLFFIASFSDFVNEKTLQKVYGLTFEQTKILKKMNGVDPLQVEKILEDHSSVCIHTICVNTNDEFPSYSQVFAGKSSPAAQWGKFAEKKIPDLDRIVHYTVVKTSELDQFTPLHTACVDGESHHHTIDCQQVKVMKNALSNSGSYPIRFVTSTAPEDSISTDNTSDDNSKRRKKRKKSKSTPAIQGSNSYLGTKTETSRCRPTPGEGPGVKEKYNLFRRDSTNVLYLPGTIHLLNALANRIFRVPSILYRALACLLICGNPRNGFISFCRIAILTINFYNKCHIDRGDALSKEESAFYLKEAKRIRDSPLTIKSEQDRMDGLIKFIEDFGVSVPTTCGIQFVKTAEGLANPNSNIMVCQAFLMLGLGLSLRMCNYMTHVFMGRVFSHCTCMPIIVVDGKAFFGTHPYIDIVNWGASGSGNITDRDREIMALYERLQLRQRNRNRG